MAIALLVISTVVATHAMRRGVGPFGLDPRVWFLGFTLPNILTFGALVAAGATLRRRPETHKRLMLLAAITLLGPALGRLIAFNFDVTLVEFVLANTAFPDVFVVAAVLYDLWQRKSVHPALLFGGLAVACFPLLLLVADTAPGLALAGMFQ